MTRIGGADAARIGDSLADFFLDGFRRVGKIDGVAQALAHFGVAVEPGQTWEFAELDLWLLDQRGIAAIEIVEAAHQLAREFDVWLLVFADWHKICVAESDVCRLADRIADEAVGHVVVAVLRSFGLDRWVVAQGVHRDEH